MRSIIVAALGAACVVAPAPEANAQLRIATWNISNYGGGRAADLQTSIYAQFEGRSMAPDALLLQEFLSQFAVDDFVSILNSAPGSPGDWVAAPFINGPDTDSAFVYRAAKVDLLDTVVVAVGGLAPNHPRNIMRYDIRPVGYAAPETVIACYSTHMKSGTASDDQARRLLEAQRVRDDAQSLPLGWSFLIGGDFNIQSSSQAAYQEMVGPQADNAGRFFDPISTPGSWNNNGAFRFVHTQDPVGAGGMDDRHDQILVSASLIEQGGLAYIGAISGGTGLPVPYSTTTWDDPNHTYRSWGNDGTSYNIALTVPGNSMVGPAIAQALKNVCVGGGHLPVFLDLRVPPAVASDSIVDFGTVAMGAPASAVLTVSNAADVALWTDSGISDLHYTLDATSGFTVSGGPHADAAGGGANEHEVLMDTSTPGPVEGMLMILSDAPDKPVRIVALSGFVKPACVGDTNGDGFIGFADLNNVLAFYGDVGEGLPGDVDGDGDVDFADLNLVVSRYGEKC